MNLKVGVSDGLVDAVINMINFSIFAAIDMHKVNIKT